MLIRPAVHPADTQIKDTCAIAVMAKASFAGRTKTRLVPPLTFQQAADLNTAFLSDIAENLSLAAERAPIASYMAYGPPGAEAFFENLLPPHVGLLETWLPNFGVCLAYATQSLLELGYGAAVVLNSDSPTLPTDWLVRTAESLLRPGDRIVLGPATDGGYYLLGMNQLHRRLFEDIDWSTERVKDQTLERANELALETIVLDPWYDVDDAASLGILAKETLSGIGFSANAISHLAPNTLSALRRLMDCGRLAPPKSIPAIEIPRGSGPA